MQDVVGIFVLRASHWGGVGRLRDMGENVLLIARDDRASDPLASAENFSVPPIFFDGKLHPSKIAQTICAEIEKRNIRVKIILNTADSASDYYILTCDQLGIGGDLLTGYRNARIKSRSRELLSAAGADTVRHEVVTRISLTEAAIDAEGITLADNGRLVTFDFPFVFKPITGTGGLGVAVIRSPDDFRKELKALVEYRASFEDLYIDGYFVYRDVLIEECIQGIELEVDGFVEDGKVTICAFGGKYMTHDGYSTKEMGGMLFPGHMPGLGSAMDSALQTWSERALAALEFRRGVFHMEVFWMGGDQFHLIELNPRIGGGMTGEMVQKLSGVDLEHEFVRLSIGGARKEWDKPEASSLIFIWHYADKPGYLEFIAPEQTLAVPIGNETYKGHWKPIYQVGTTVTEEEIRGELYLGRLLIHNADFDGRDIEPIIEDLFNWLRSRDLVEMASEAPIH